MFTLYSRLPRSLSDSQQAFVFLLPVTPTLFLFFIFSFHNSRRAILSLFPSHTIYYLKPFAKYGQVQLNNEMYESTN